MNRYSAVYSMETSSAVPFLDWTAAFSKPTTVAYFLIRRNALLDFPSPQTVGFKVERPWVDLISSWGAWLFAMGRFVLPMGRFSIGHGAHMANRWGLSPKGEPDQTIGVDIGVAARFAQNNQKNIAPCRFRLSHPATQKTRF